MHGPVGGASAGEEGNPEVGETSSGRVRAALAVPVLLATACLAAALTTLASGNVRHGWSALAALAVGSLVAQIVRPGRPHAATDRTAIAFAAAGAVLLPPQLLLVLIVVHVAASWLGHRRPWLERQPGSWRLARGAAAHGLPARTGLFGRPPARRVG